MPKFPLKPKSRGRKTESSDLWLRRLVSSFVQSRRVIASAVSTSCPRAMSAA